MALTLESHLDELISDLKDSKFPLGAPKPQKRIGELEGSCFVCKRIEL
jgi:hypothetical protein